MMDRSIEQEVLQTKRKKWAVYIILMLLVLAGTVFLLRFAFGSTIKSTAITTAEVRRGDIENTINASGEILPEFEEVLSSPIAASIKKVLLNAGSAIQAGQSILTLDKSAAQTEFEKLNFQLQSKQNDIRKIKLELDKSFFDIQSNNAIKQLHINSFRADVENAKRLLNAGGGTREDVERAELALKVALLEKKQLEEEIRTRQQTMRLQIKTTEIAAQLQSAELQELSRQLKQADISASRSGVVTWVNQNIGAVISPGEVIARIANLSGFKIKGTLSDQYADQLQPGMSAVIKINETQLRGKVSRIYPAVKDGSISFDIIPEDRNNKLFRPNLKADVFLVTDKRHNVLLVANGPAFTGAENESVYVLKDGIATKMLVKTGLSNFDFIELKGQLKEGDTIITSDMSDFKHSTRIKIEP